jgi:hypothetical protein
MKIKGEQIEPDYNSEPQNIEYLIRECLRVESLRSIFLKRKDSFQMGNLVLRVRSETTG